MARAAQGLLGEHWGFRSLDGLTLPDSPENREQRYRIMLSGLLGVIAAALPTTALIALTGWPEEGTVAAAFVIMPLSLVLPLILRLASRGPLWTIHLYALLCDLVVVGSALGLGAGFSPFAVSLCWVVLAIVLFLIADLRAGVAHVAVIGVCYAAVLVVQDGNASPASRWVSVVGIVAITGWWVSRLVERTRDLAISEHEAHVVAEQARSELATLNATLEERVISQVDELARLGGLRRFLSAPVADAVLSGNAQLLEPHRRQIAVFFCDLRGFTSFAGGAEPEDVVDVLREYYVNVGDVLRRHDATVGTFAGDGIMAYLGDPVPRSDSAQAAVAMAIELRQPLRQLAQSWTRLGHPIGYGMGIAFGYATLGLIGFEGRNDYTALGSVVNLASRLCGEAADGEILLDQRAYDEVRGTVETELVEVTVKGIPTPITAHRIAAL